MAFYLKMPTDIIDSLTIAKVTKLSQPRRSKIKEEVLVTLQSSHQRDTVQSFASNLAAAQGQAGMRMEVPDALRGLFRLFETHAVALKDQFGPIKRSIRFEDTDQSLYMDVKLDTTDWIRITADEMRDLAARKKKAAQQSISSGSQPETADKRRVLFLDPASQQYPCVDSENEETGC